MGRPRSVVEDALPRWEQTSAVGQRSSGSLAEVRRKRAQGGGPSSGDSPEPNEVVRSVLGVAWIAGAAILVVLCLAFTVGAMLMLGVLHEIAGARNYDAATGRMTKYEQFFAQVSSAGFTVNNDRPNINEGVKQFLWTVNPPGSEQVKVFSWRHNLKRNDVRPTSNPAAMLDVELGNINAAQAQEFATEKSQNADGTEGVVHIYTWDPKDQVARAIIERNVSAFATNNPGGWVPKIADAAPPIPAPLIDPKSRTRPAVGAAAATDQPADAAAPDAPAPADGTGVANPVQPPDAGQPPADGQAPPDQSAPPAAGAPDLRANPVQPAPAPPAQTEPPVPPADAGGGGDAKGDTGSGTGNGSAGTTGGDSGKSKGKGLKGKLRRLFKPRSPKKEGDATPVG